MCEICEPAWQAVPQGELLYSLQGFPSCPLLGSDIMFEETNIRYTALAYFFFFF